ncbi:MAG: lipoprotein-releasing system ATP-binding protein LolD [Thermodesulfovibrio sp.]|nr:lipoprotein-releasing system ATP-binding protein LolD [Thermodesulfovibrio sp.]
MSEFIETKGLKKIYHVGGQKVEALKGVDLEIAKGDFVVFMGHSGSGKTTLVSTIGGLTRPTEGTVLIEGNDIWKLNDKQLSHFRNRKIGFMFQSFSLLPTLNVLNNVVMPAIFSTNSERKDTEALKSKAISLLTDLDMKRKVNSFPSELSGGEQRRVAIARALINDPEIILADEPTGELDIRTEREVIDIFCQINKTYQKTLIVVSHSLTWLEKAKTIIVMKDGLIFKDLADPVEAIMEGVCKS